MTNAISGRYQQGGDDKRAQFAQAREASFDAAASVLKESPDELKSELAGGKSLSDIAQEKGVSSDDLQKAVTDALKKSNPNMSDDRASTIASRMISGHHHHHMDAAKAGDDQQPPSGAPPAQSDLPDGATISIKA